MIRPAETLVVGLSVVAVCAATLAQTATETFTATASIKKGSVQATADVTVQVQRYASETERATLIKTVREGGTAAGQKVLATMPDAGFIQLGERRTPIKFAVRRPTAGGELITVLTAAPIVFVGAGLPDAEVTTGFEVAVAILDVKAEGGVGELASAANIGIDDGGAITVENYGPTVIWLNRLVRAR